MAVRQCLGSCNEQWRQQSAIAIGNVNWPWRQTIDTGNWECQLAIPISTCTNTPRLWTQFTSGTQKSIINSANHIDRRAQARPQWPRAPRIMTATTEPVEPRSYCVLRPPTVTSSGGTSISEYSEHGATYRQWETMPANAKASKDGDQIENFSTSLEHDYIARLAFLLNGGRPVGVASARRLPSVDDGDGW